MRLFLLLALCWSAFAQTPPVVPVEPGPVATMRMADGSLRQIPLVSGGGESLVIEVPNTGLPENWGNAWTPGDPIYFDALEATVPGMVPILHGAVEMAAPSGRWLLARPDQYKYRSYRYGSPSHPKFAAMAQHHAIMPGDRFYGRFVPKDDLWEKRWLSTIPPSNVAKFVSIFGKDHARRAKWPWLARVDAQFVYDAASLNRNAPVGQRTAGWYEIPENFLVRFPYQPGGLRAMTHWYALGHKEPGATLTNEKYDVDLVWMREGVENLDVARLGIGLAHLRAKCAYGLIRHDGPGLFKNRLRNEKGDSVRGSTGMQPDGSKEFGRSIAAGYVLLGRRDPLIAQAFDDYSAFLKSSPPPWDGHWGARRLGQPLLTLLAFYRATGDPEFKATAEAAITYAFTPAVNGSRLFFREEPQLGCSGGEGLTALVGCCRWVFEEGVRPDLKPHLQAMQDWYVDNAGRYQDDAKTLYKAGYFVDPTVTPATVTWSGDFQASWWPRENDTWTTPKMRAASAAADRYMFTLYPMTTWDAGTCCDGPPRESNEGTSWNEKWLAIIASN